MERPFIHRPPTEKELERLRLLLSTYQDGSGMLKVEEGTLPGWRDFERACALTFNGITVESKFFVDVIFPFNETSFYGIDCKMRRELGTADRKGIITVEVTNAAALLWSHLRSKGISEANYADEPDLAGYSLLDAIEQLKDNSSALYPRGPILTDASYYLVLLWQEAGDYQLFQLPLEMPRPSSLQWTCHVSQKKGGGKTTRLVGSDDNGVLYEWYGDSGGQLKYYPQVSSALWSSPRFRLEPLPKDIDEGTLAKAKAYFGDLWALANQE